MMRIFRACPVPDGRLLGGLPRDISGLDPGLDHEAAFAIPMIFVSHQAGEVERLASDIAVSSQGRLVEARSGAAWPTSD
jgi:hypothetical protein